MRLDIFCTLAVSSLLTAGCAAQTGKAGVNNPEAVMAEKNRMVITLSASGGYVPLEGAFLGGVPYLAIDPEGRVIRLMPEPEGRLDCWKVGKLSREEVAALVQKLGELGFWEWDGPALEKEIFAKQLITDLPTTCLSVCWDGREKVFCCYGLRQYRSIHHLAGLEKPVQALKLLESLPVAQPYYPPEMEILLLPAERPAGAASAAAWPLAELPPLATEGPFRGYRLGRYQGGAVRQLLDLLQPDGHISIQGKPFRAVCRPAASMAR